MPSRYRTGATATGDLLLLLSVVTLVPSWIGGVELLAAVGLGEFPAVAVSGVYAWGRAGFSGAVLLRRWRTGSLTLTASWLSSTFESVAGRAPMADYPAPTTDGLSLSAGPAAVPA